MLRTTRRNRDSTSRKTLKRQVYAQEGGFILMDSYDLPGSDRFSKMSDRKLRWINELKKDQYKEPFAPLVKVLESSSSTPTEKFDALLLCHMYQDKLLLVPLDIIKQEAGITSALSLATIKTHYSSITATLGEIAYYFSIDIMAMLDFKKDYTGTIKPTDRINFFYNPRKNLLIDILLKPLSLTNMFIYTLANLFLRFKQDFSEIKELQTGVDSDIQTGTTEYLSHHYNNYIIEESVAKTTRRPAGSFYLSQDFDEYKTLINGVPDYDDYISENFFLRALLTQFVVNKERTVECRSYDTRINKGVNMNDKETKATEYDRVRKIWVDLVSDLFFIYSTLPPTWTMKDILTAFTYTSCKIPLPSSSVTSATISIEALHNIALILEQKILGTEITLKQILEKMDYNAFSFMIHLFAVLRENENEYTKQNEGKTIPPMAS